MMNKENLQNEILLEEQKELDRHKITAAQMPKVIEPVVLIVSIVVSNLK